MATSAFDEFDELKGANLQPYYGQDNAGSLLRYLAALIRRNIWLVLAILAAAFAAGVVVTMLQTPRYTARATLEINDRSDQVLGEELETPTDSNEAWDVDRFLNTQLQILNSRSLAERVSSRLGLEEDAAFFAAMQAGTPDEYDSPQERQAAVIAMLMENMDAELADVSRIARLSFTSIDPVVSANVVNAFSQEFIEANLQRRFDSSSYARNFVAEQLEESRTQLETSERELNDYARQAGLIRTQAASDQPGAATGSSSVTASSLMQLNEAANQASATRVAAEARWNAERAQPLLSSPAALASPTVQRLQARRSDLTAELEAARARYFADHPTVQRLASDLASTEEQLNRAAAEARNAVRAEYQAAQSAEAALMARVGGLQGDIQAEQALSVRYNTLARQADTNRQIYEGLLQRFRELNASAGITASNISIIDQANPPTEPSSPNIVFNVLVALILGVILCAALLFIRDQLDDRIRVPEEVEGKTGLKLLGVIPVSETEDPVAELEDPKSAIAEAYSSLRSSLMYSTPDGLPNVVLFTSSQGSEGKSTTSFAIAQSVAKAGKRTLIIDSDLRRPNLHRFIKGKAQNGLSDILVGEKTLGEVVVANVAANMDLVTAGGIPPNPAELLSSQRMTNLLAEAAEKYDFVILDCPPVLGLADSPSLSAMVDAVVLVIEAERGRSGQLKAAIRRLRAMQPLILGAVLTKFDPSQGGNSYSSYYGYDYYSYSGDKR